MWSFNSMSLIYVNGGGQNLRKSYSTISLTTRVEHVYIGALCEMHHVNCYFNTVITNVFIVNTAAAATIGPENGV